MTRDPPELLKTASLTPVQAIPPVAARHGSGLSARLGALRYPQYRRFWLGGIASVGGFNLNVLAQGVLVFDLTGSPLNLGIVGAATAIPTIAVNSFGGVLADRLDKKRLLMTTQLLLAALLALLATLDALGVVKVWHVYAIAGATGMVTGLDWPARQAIFTRLIQREGMMSAVALNSVLWQGSRVVIPSIGGNLIAWFGTSVVFYLAAAGFVAMYLVLMSLRVPQLAGTAGRNVLRQFAEGVRYIARTKMFAVLIPLTYANMFFGMIYIQLMPAYADLFAAGPRGLGYLFTAVGTGAVAGTLLTARLRGRKPLGWLILGGSFAFAILVGILALSPVYLTSIAILFVAGVFNSVFLISSMTVMQMRVPERLRGRVMGLHGITFSMIPLGGLFGGVIADTWGVRTAIATGALILALTVAAVTVAQREVRELDGRELA